MFLTRKAIKKIRLLTGAYVILGVLCLILSGILARLGAESRLIFILGLVCWLLAVFFRQIGRYSEGKGQLLNQGNRLVFQQLRPAEFIRLYQEKRDSSENVVSKPDFDVLRLVAAAYDALEDTERELETLDEMLSAASEKKKPLAILLKSAVLFSIGKVEEAEQLFVSVYDVKMDPVTTAVSDAVLKSDRAMALGDYVTAEIYHQRMLTRTFPKNTPLGLLCAHFSLARIYSMTGRRQEAELHCRYCVEHGGETAIKTKAEEMLNSL